MYKVLILITLVLTVSSVVRAQELKQIFVEYLPLEADCLIEELADGTQVVYFTTDNQKYSVHESIADIKIFYNEINLNLLINKGIITEKVYIISNKRKTSFKLDL